jgi:pyruvate/2-oxoglutarate dehydrogenase complex dihydrolipoamide acyltransferase (E2) component
MEGARKRQEGIRRGGHPITAQGPNSSRGGSPQRSGGERPSSEPRPDGPVEDREARLLGEDPDVVLDVPTLNIEELDLEVEDLRAHVSVRAEVANFVNINIGVDAYLDKLKLGIKGVEAQVLLKVKLERILGTIERALSAIEQNPGLLDDRLRGSGQDAAQIEGSVEGSAGETDDQGPQEPSPGSAPEGDAEVEVTTAARRKAEELGVNLSRVQGSGVRGRVLVTDVQKAAG